jgi:hypothetical protein
MHSSLVRRMESNNPRHKIEKFDSNRFGRSGVADRRTRTVTLHVHYYERWCYANVLQAKKMKIHTAETTFAFRWQ